MSEVDMGGVFFLQEDITPQRIEHTIENLIAQHQSIELNCPQERMIESFFDRDDFWKRFGRSKYHCYLKFGKIEFSFDNCERAGNMWKYIYNGRRQIYLDVWGSDDEDESEIDTFILFLNNPEVARDFIDIFCTIGSSLGAYLGFLGGKHLLDDEYDTTGTIYIERLLEHYSSFYIDKCLADDIGLNLLRDEASILKPVSESGYFISYSDHPFIAGLKKINTVYYTEILPIIIDRIRSEFASIEYIHR